MAKISFTKLGLKVNQDIKTIEYNGQNIEVKQYLPITTKLDLISDSINMAMDDNYFANTVKLEVFLTMCIIEEYTNIIFTDKQRAEVQKTYDLLKGAGLTDIIIDAIPQKEYNFIINSAHALAEAMYNYRNSVMGILETISADYSALNLDASAIQQKLADPDNISLLKDVLTKLG